MGRIILMLLLVVVSKNTMAEWVNIYSDENFAIYTDPSTINKNGTIVKMWSLYDYKVAQVLPKIPPALSETSQKEYDCAEKKYRQLYLTIHAENMGKGTTVRNNDEVGNWSPFQPDSLNEMEWKIACGKK
jgi:hypothetical protein